MKFDWNVFFIKLTSRKLCLAVAGFISGIVLALGYAETQATQISALIMSGASVIAYIVGEGLVDAKEKQDSQNPSWKLRELAPLLDENRGAKGFIWVDLRENLFS